MCDDGINGTQNLKELLLVVTESQLAKTPKNHSNASYKVQGRAVVVLVIIVVETILIGLES